MRQLAKHCHPYIGADTKAALFQLTITAVGYFALCALVYFCFSHEAYWLAALFILPAAGLLVRLFIIQHDCGHQSFFHSPRVNNWVGRCISVLTFTPYDFWRKAHAMHHSASGNLNGRGAGSIDTLTVKEYQALPERQRRLYKIYRNPFCQTVIFPFIFFAIVQRFPPSQSNPFLKDFHPMPASKSWRSILPLNVALILFFIVFEALVGWKFLLLFYLPVLYFSACIGGWLFFIQHQFEITYWKYDASWDFHAAAIFGSSYYVLPPLLQWLTANIGIHHIHHLCPMIPSYKLQTCLEGSPALQAMNRLTLWESLKCVRWALWDEDQKKMIAFSDLKST